MTNDIKRGCLFVHKGNIRYRRPHNHERYAPNVWDVELAVKTRGSQVIQWEHIGRVAKGLSFWSFNTTRDTEWQGSFETRAMAADHLLSWVFPFSVCLGPAL